MARKTKVGRKFDGKQYWWSGFAFSKKEAKTKAEAIRARGYSARVVEGQTRRKSNTWDVYQIDYEKYRRMRKRGPKKKRK